MKRLILAFLAVTTMSVSAFAEDCVPEKSGKMNCTGTSRPNLQGGMDCR